MEFTHKALGARFVVPDKLTVRQQLAFISEAATTRTPDLIENLWRASLLVITEWECPHLPDRHVDLETVDNPRAADTIVWAATQVKAHVQRLEELPKN